jgi:hypothetical protein
MRRHPFGSKRRACCCLSHLSTGAARIGRSTCREETVLWQEWDQEATPTAAPWRKSVLNLERALQATNPTAATANAVATTKGELAARWAGVGGARFLVGACHCHLRRSYRPGGSAPQSMAPPNLPSAAVAWMTKYRQVASAGCCFPGQRGATCRDYRSSIRPS